LRDIIALTLGKDPG